jgi:hypothetical protein
MISRSTGRDGPTSLDAGGIWGLNCPPVDKPKDNDVEAGDVRKPYAEPRLIRHGDASALTLAKNAPGKEPNKNNGSQVT